MTTQAQGIQAGQSVAVGLSGLTDPSTAGSQAARMATKQLEGRRPRCAIVFGSSWFDQEVLLRGVDSVLDGVPIVGGSTAGELTPDGPQSHTCVVVAIADDRLVMSIGLGERIQNNPRLAGHEAAQQAMRQLNQSTRSGLLFFGDGLATGYDEVMHGIHEVLGTSSVMAGALMGDDLRFTRTYQYGHNRAHTGSVVAVVFGGGRIGVGLEHGFSPISKLRQITRAHGNIIYEIDGQPAASVYKEYFGADELALGPMPTRITALSMYPIGIRHELSGRYLLRSVLGISKDGSLSCTGQMPVGEWLQMMIGTRDLALQAASLAAQQAVQMLRTVRFVLVFDSIVRQRALVKEPAGTLQRVRETVGPSVPIVGCYTYGELGPLGGTAPFGMSAPQIGCCLVVAVGS